MFFTFTVEHVYSDHLIEIQDLPTLACSVISIFASIILSLLDKHFTNIKTFIFPFS